MTEIELRNENGKIVGYDSNGNKVPVSFEDGSFDSVRTDETTLEADDGTSVATLSAEENLGGSGDGIYHLLLTEENSNNPSILALDGMGIGRIVSDGSLEEGLKMYGDGVILENDLAGNSVLLESRGGEDADGNPSRVALQTAQSDEFTKADRLTIYGRGRDLEDAQWQRLRKVQYTGNIPARYGGTGKGYLDVFFDEGGSNDGRIVTDSASTPINIRTGSNGQLYITDRAVQFNNTPDLNGRSLQGNGAGARVGFDDFTKHPPRSSPPSSPENGDMAYADGTNWDPGSGEGFYGYEAGAWVKL